MQTLLELVETWRTSRSTSSSSTLEHTFAYRNYEPVWRGWGALTGEEMLQLDARCRELGIDLVPNQNSFGHLRYWLEYPPLEEAGRGERALRVRRGSLPCATRPPWRPTTRAPCPSCAGSLMSCCRISAAGCFNVGCDETWDLGRGQSKRLCAAKGTGRVYLDFLKKIHREVAARGRQTMFWGDMILQEPRLLRELPRDMIALNWGYEPDHPFEREAGLFAKAKLRFTSARARPRG